ncbi:hypothetical protein [Jiulongibacter sediminis]|jgi:hypothetical protein|nr:hypothetical protein [Jiulongibacter sediminis]
MNKNSNKGKVKDVSDELTIHDCLKLIGMKEITANVYSTHIRKS